ncbi:MAG: hypothetical protein GWN14_21280, partial [candidate division Zixibacteria bacterium]|nr:hypothetical protein [Gammaproteobacteria bacterium]NIX58376.1 hypothetical protein [candidate division Zixibacteria bacterium]
GQSGTVSNTDISDIAGSLTGTEADYQILSMPEEGFQSGAMAVKTDTDFLWGSAQFNYIFDGPPVESGNTYQLSLSHPDFEPISAEATIPGDFR